MKSIPLPDWAFAHKVVSVTQIKGCLRETTYLSRDEIDGVAYFEVGATTVEPNDPWPSRPEPEDPPMSGAEYVRGLNNRARAAMEEMETPRVFIPRDQVNAWRRAALALETEEVRYSPPQRRAPIQGLSAWMPVYTGTFRIDRTDD